MQKLQLESNLGSHAGPVSSVVFFSDKVISASLDRSVRIWNPANPNPSQRTSLVCTMEDWALSLALSARKSFTTLAAGSCDGSIRLFDLTNHRNLSTLQGDNGHKSAASALEWTGENTLFSAGYDGKMLLWDITTKDPVASCMATAPISSACQISPDVFAAACINGTYALHDLRTQAPVSNMGKYAKDRPLRIARLTSSSFAIAGSGKKICVCDIRAGGGSVVEWTGHMDSVTSLASTSDGSIVVSGSADKTIRVWNACTGKAIALGRVHTDDVSAVAIQVIGEKVSIAAGSADGKSLSGLSFVLKEAITAGFAVPVAAPARLVQGGSVDVDAID